MLQMWSDVKWCGACVAVHRHGGSGFGYIFVDTFQASSHAHTATYQPLSHHLRKFGFSRFRAGGRVPKI